MKKLAISMALLLSTEASLGGVVIDLLPVMPGPYAPGQHVNLSVRLAQEPGGEDVYLRLVQLDFVDTDPALTLDEAFQFDYSAQAACAGNTGLCGVRHAEFPQLTPGQPYGWNLMTSTVYTGFTHDPELQMRLPAEGSITIGTIGVVLPTQPGDYVIDVMNSDAPAACLGNCGAGVAFGFGGSSGPDLYTMWMADNDETSAGGRFSASTTADAAFTFAYTPVPGLMTPEPTTLVLLVAGGLVGLARRRARR